MGAIARNNRLNLVSVFPASGTWVVFLYPRPAGKAYFGVQHCPVSPGAFAEGVGIVTGLENQTER